jgi:RNA polymerase sigma-70 factor, ECF subfamily
MNAASRMTIGKGNSSRKGDHGDDLALVHLAGEGDVTARHKLAERLINRVRSTAFYLSAGDPEAEDYAQMAFIEILESASSFRGESSLETWAERITIRTTLRYIKRRRRRSKIVIFDSEKEDQFVDTAETDLNRSRVSRRVTTIMGTLKPKHRIALTMRLAFGYSVAEIAEMTDTPFNTVRERLRSGRKKLSRKFEKDPLLIEWIHAKEAP